MAKSVDTETATPSARLAAALESSIWLASLPEQVRNELLAAATIRSFAPGQTLYAQGEPPKGLFGVLSGTIQTVGLSTEGYPALLSVLRRGEWTGFAGLVDGMPNSFSTIAATPTDVAFVPQTLAARILCSDVDRMRLVARPLIEILRFSYRFLVETNGRSPRRVVAQRIIDLSRCIYVEGLPTGTVVDSVSQEDMAAATYLTRPTVNKVLRELEEEGIVRLGYGRIEIVNVSALQAVASAIDSVPGNTLLAEPNEPTASDPGNAEPFRRDRVLQVLEAGRWFNALPRATKLAIVNAATVRTYRAGDTIFGQGQGPDGLYALLSGQLRGYGVASDGGRTLFSLIHSGDWLGFVPYIVGGRHPFSCVARRASTVLILPPDAVSSIFLSDIAHYRMLLAPPLATLRVIYDFLVETNGRAPLRLVARRLFDLARIINEHGSRPRDFIDSLNQTDLAEATGLSRPTVNKVLIDLERQGAISIGYGRVRIVDADLLLRLARAAVG